MRSVIRPQLKFDNFEIIKGYITDVLKQALPTYNQYLYIQDNVAMMLYDAIGMRFSGDKDIIFDTTQRVLNY